jgi:hypothetical protein
VKRLLLGVAALGGVAAVAWEAHALNAEQVEAVAPDDEATAPVAAASATPSESAADVAPTEAPKAAAPVTPDRPLSRDETPMAQRVAILGLLNKRSGESRDLKLTPGQAIRVGDVIVRLRACEATAPWESQKLTGAFVQVDVRNRDGTWRRPFSGWLYRESPSLNAVEDPIYDVWPKSCTMTHPDIGPDTVRVAGSVASSAKKSAADRNAPAISPGTNTPVPTPSAESSNATY